MKRHTYKAAGVLAAVGGLLAATAPAAFAAPDAAAPHKVSVVGNGSSVTLSTSTVTGNTVTFATSTTAKGGSQIVAFSLQNGATLAKVFADFGEEFSNNPKTDAKGTRDLTHDAFFVGLADPTAGRPVTVSEQLPAGTYYVLDIAKQGSGAPKVATLTVKAGSNTVGLGAPNVTIKANSADKFVAPKAWAAKGVLSFQNVSDTLHFMDMTPVKAGTTDAQVQKYFDSGSNKPPAFLRPGPGFSLEVQSPGHSVRAAYNLPAGTYVLLCFVADKTTGMPHALMGMHEVVQLG